jgi:hypothetical protein
MCLDVSSGWALWCRTAHLLLVEIRVLIYANRVDLVLGFVSHHFTKAIAESTTQRVIFRVTIVFLAVAISWTLKRETPLRRYSRIEKNVHWFSRNFRTYM